MATYYETLEDALALPSSVTGRADFEALVAEAEADLLARYTRSTPYYSGYGYGWRGWFPHVAWGEVGTDALLSDDATRAVYLRYYHPDAADVGDTEGEVAFMAAFALELRALILWKAQQADADGALAATVASESRGRRSVTYRETGGAALANTYPPGFGRHLRPYDLRPPVTVG